MGGMCSPGKTCSCRSGAQARRACSRVRGTDGSGGATSGGDRGAFVPRALRAVAHRLIGEAVDDEALRSALNPLEVDAKARFAELVCALAEGELPAGKIEPSRGLLARACTAAERVERPSLVVMSHALLAHAEHALGHREAAQAHLDSASCALTPSVPMARALRILEAVAQALGGIARASSRADCCGSPSTGGDSCSSPLKLSSSSMTCPRKLR